MTLATVTWIFVSTGEQPVSSCWISPFENVFDRVRACDVVARREGRLATYQLYSEDGLLLFKGSHKQCEEYEYMFGLNFWDGLLW
jgi:hypothetical protein